MKPFQVPKRVGLGNSDIERSQAPVVFDADGNQIRFRSPQPRVFIDEKARVSPNVSYSGAVVICGNVTVADDVILEGSFLAGSYRDPLAIGSGSRIKDSKVTGKAVIRQSQLERCIVDSKPNLTGAKAIDCIISGSGYVGVDVYLCRSKLSGDAYKLTQGCSIRHSIVRGGAEIHGDIEVTDSLLLKGADIHGGKITNTIVDFETRAGQYDMSEFPGPTLKEFAQRMCQDNGESLQDNYVKVQDRLEKVRAALDKDLKGIGRVWLM